MYGVAAANTRILPCFSQSIGTGSKIKYPIGCLRLGNLDGMLRETAANFVVAEDLVDFVGVLSGRRLH